MLTIAIDYDNTFTAAPKMWAEWINIARRFGHRVICVTSRRPTNSARKQIDDSFDEHGIVIAVWFTSGSAKQWYMNEIGVKVDIWIEDNPQSIVSAI